MSMAVYIPVVPKDVIEKRAETIKPLIRDKDEVLRHIAPVDLFNTAYTWSPVFTDKVDPKDLKWLDDITTFHSYAYYGFFKPSISEVLAQIPDALLEKAVAFTLIKSPEDAADLNRNSAALNDGYHVAKIRVFGRAEV